MPWLFQFLVLAGETRPSVLREILVAFDRRELRTVSRQSHAGICRGKRELESSCERIQAIKRRLEAHGGVLEFRVATSSTLDKSDEGVPWACAC